MKTQTPVWTYATVATQYADSSLLNIFFVDEFVRDFVRLLQLKKRHSYTFSIGCHKCAIWLYSEIVLFWFSQKRSRIVMNVVELRQSVRMCVRVCVDLSAHSTMDTCKLSIQVGPLWTDTSGVMINWINVGIDTRSRLFVTPHFQINKQTMRLCLDCTSFDLNYLIRLKCSSRCFGTVDVRKS